MGLLEKYDVELRNMKSDVCELDFELDDTFLSLLKQPRFIKENYMLRLL